MDEEDLTELRADQKLVSEHDEMDILDGTQGERAHRMAVDDNQKECVLLIRSACGLCSTASCQSDDART